MAASRRFNGGGKGCLDDGECGGPLCHIPCIDWS